MNPASPTDAAPPPAYQLPQEEFDQKTSQVLQNALEVDEDGWEVYDPAAFEAGAENLERSPPSSSSARIFGSDTIRREVQGRRRSSAKVLPLTSLKVRSWCSSFSRSVPLTQISPDPKF